MRTVVVSLAGLIRLVLQEYAMRAGLPVVATIGGRNLQMEGVGNSANFGNNNKQSNAWWLKGGSIPPVAIKETTHGCRENRDEDGGEYSSL